MGWGVWEVSPVYSDCLKLWMSLVHSERCNQHGVTYNSICHKMMFPWQRLFIIFRGCFLTTSLTATLALSLTIPMSMICDIILDKVSYHLSSVLMSTLMCSIDHHIVAFIFSIQTKVTWMFYAGIAPVFIAFFAVSFLSHYDNWDPVYLAVRKCCQCLLRRRLLPRSVDAS